jgi:hypothetical protein
MIKISDRPCFMHRDQRAATCRSCYDEALEQQRAQVARVRKQTHEAYLKRQQEIK